jgi:hypothetical protein
MTFRKNKPFLSIEPLERRTLFTGPGIGPIDAANLGKGDWIWQIGSAETNLGVSGSVQGLVDKEKAAGMDWITVKCGDGDSIWSQFTQDLVDRAHHAGLKIFAWAYMYGAYQAKDTIQGEIAVAKNALDLGADGFICDAEGEYEQQPESAVHQFFNGGTNYNGILDSYPDVFYAYAPFPYISLHTGYPYGAFNTYCDAVMPQDYWATIGTSPNGSKSPTPGQTLTPAHMVADGDAEFKYYYSRAITTQAAHPSKQSNWVAMTKLPIVPIGQAYSPATSTDITNFVNALKNDATPANGAYKGVSYWSAQHETSAMRTSITSGDIGNPAPEFVAGQTVYVTASSLKAWSDPSSASPATYVAKPQNTLATIVSNGPVAYAQSFDRYQLRYLGDSSDTYSANFYLAAVTSAPATPGLTSPADGSTTTSTSPTINWTDSQWAISYDVYLDGVLKQNVSATTSQLALSSLSYQNHTWQVKAKNSVGTTAGAIWNIGVVPLAPTGLSASDGTTNSAIHLAWNATTGATTYAVFRNSTNNSATATQIGTTGSTTYDDSTVAGDTTAYYWVKALNASSQPGAFSNGDAGLRDTIDPIATSPAFTYNALPQAITVQFSENVQNSLAAGDVSVQDENDLAAPAFQPSSWSYDGATNTATFNFSSALPDSNYQATIASGNVRDPANNPLSSNVTVDFFTLSGDGNHDRVVDIQDFNLLAVNFGKSGMTYSQGNYDYSADNTVTITDFNVLATNFGRSMPAPAGGSSIQSLAAAETMPLSHRTSPAARSSTISNTTAGQPKSMSDEDHLLRDAGLT